MKFRFIKQLIGRKNPSELKISFKSWDFSLKAATVCHLEQNLLLALHCSIGSTGNVRPFDRGNFTCISST
jgi:hypothetical protein